MLLSISCFCVFELLRKIKYYLGHFQLSLWLYWKVRILLCVLNQLILICCSYPLLAKACLCFIPAQQTKVSDWTRLWHIYFKLFPSKNCSWGCSETKADYCASPPRHCLIFYICLLCDILIEFLYVLLWLRAFFPPDWPYRTTST